MTDNTLDELPDTRITECSCRGVRGLEVDGVGVWVTVTRTCPEHKGWDGEPWLMSLSEIAAADGLLEALEHTFGD